MLLEFAKIRSSLPPLVIFTSHESSEKLMSPWTSSSLPSALVLHRLQQLAGEALGMLSARVLDADSITGEDAKVRMEQYCGCGWYLNCCPASLCPAILSCVTYVCSVLLAVVLLSCHVVSVVLLVVVQDATSGL